MKALIILTFLTACGSETDKSLAEKIDAYDTKESAPAEISSVGSSASHNEDSDHEAEPDVKISRPDLKETHNQPEGCGDFAMEGDFRAAANSQTDIVLSVKMNDECDYARFSYVKGKMQVSMCSNSTEWLLADKSVKTKVTEIAIVRADGMLKFEYRTNGKTEQLEYLTIKGELENQATVCLEKVR